MEPTWQPTFSNLSCIMKLFIKTFKMSGEITLPCLPPRKKVARTRLPSIGLWSWSRFLADDVSHKPDGRLPLLSTRPAVTSATLKRAAWWTEARRVWTVCLRLLPNSVTTAIWTRAFCTWVQHANHSATEPHELKHSRLPCMANFYDSLPIITQCRSDMIIQKHTENCVHNNYTNIVKQPGVLQSNQQIN